MDDPLVPVTVPPEVQAEFNAALDAYEKEFREKLEKFLAELGVTIIEPKTISEHEER